MAWSNQQIFDEVSKLPDEIYALRASEGEWPVGKILNHLLNAAEWFRYCLTGQKWSEIPRITSSAKLLELRPYLLELDNELIAQAKLEDELLTFQDENGPVSASRSLILAQAVMHTAEHKGQLATILKANGFELDLDKFDVWTFESQTK